MSARADRRVTDRGAGSTYPGMLSDCERRHAARQILRDASAELAQLRRIRGAYRKTAARIARTRARLALAAALLAAPLATPAHAGAPRFDNGAFGIGITASSATPAFADIDGDGDLDAFVGDRYGVTWFFENTGSQSAPAFGPASPGAFGLADVGLNSRPAFVDIDGDGDLDAFVGERYGSTFFFENTGSALAPAFATPVSGAFGLASVGLRPAPAFADIDGDGDFDALLGGIDGNTAFFRNTGSASAPAFAAPSTNPFGLADVGDRSSPVFADVDGDGDLDALYGSLAGDTYLFENTGSAAAPAFGAPQANALGLEATLGSTAVALADIDGDGDLDAFLGDFYGSTIFFENGGTPNAPAFLSASTNPFGQGAVAYRPAPTFADIDGDGDLDAFVGDHYGNTRFFENTGTAGAAALGAPVTNPFGLADVGAFASPAFGDLDGDGDLDALVGSYFGVLRYFANTGTAAAPSFAAPVASPFGLADVGNRATPALADLDGDGDLDALVGNSLGDTLFFENTGTAGVPAFAPASTNPFGLAKVGTHAAPAVADLDRDGRLDASIGVWAGDTVYFANTGTRLAPAFAAPVANPFGLYALKPFTTPAFADLDGDGDLDAFIGGYLDRVFYFENRELDADACIDGVDNDGDGQVDAADPGCANGSDTSELSTAQCDNGVDDDGDGAIDWRGDGSGDPQCVGSTDNLEAPTPAPSCGMGPELLLVAPLAAAARRRKQR